MPLGTLGYVFHRDLLQVIGQNHALLKKRENKITYYKTYFQVCVWIDQVFVYSISLSSIYKTLQCILCMIQKEDKCQTI